MTSKLRLNRPCGSIVNQQDRKKIQVRCNTKVLLTVFFYFNDVVHYAFLPRDQTVNKERNQEVQCHLRE